MSTKTIYDVERISTATKLAAPKLRAKVLAKKPTPKLDDEVAISATRLGICQSCGCQTEQGSPIYWIPGTGLARHTVCAPSDDYTTRLAAYHADLASAAATRETRTIIEAVQFLREPRYAAMRIQVVGILHAADEAPMGGRGVLRLVQ